jgi:sugar/nucleoside kinase (ribokinase family)
MSGNRDFDVVGLGLNAVDHICTVPRFPRFGEKLGMTDFTRTVGGQVASALVACRRWGLRARYLGKVGTDEMGDFSFRSLEREGLDLSRTTRVPGAVNQFAFILVDGSSGERTIIWKRDSRLAFQPEEIDPEAVSVGRFLLLDGHDAPAAARAAELARAAGVEVVMDAETVKPGTDLLVSNSDYVVCAAEFPGRFTGETDLRRGLDSIRSAGPAWAVATRGSEGALALGPGGMIRSPGFKVECVDSTGAGDVFHGAFIYGLAQDWPMDRILDFANAAAGLNCTSVGARGGIRPLAEILEFMDNGERR